MFLSIGRESLQQAHKLATNKAFTHQTREMMESREVIHFCFRPQGLVCPFGVSLIGSPSIAIDRAGIAVLSIPPSRMDSLGTHRFRDGKSLCDDDHGSYPTVSFVSYKNHVHRHQRGSTSYETKATPQHKSQSGEIPIEPSYSCCSRVHTTSAVPSFLLKG